ncbi:MAG TPA: preprotein translocase subunit YajC [Microbacteriaceae bacterium]|nr:preprotein translocase subunit YajC [Microbacteriaceae bacterium]
MDPIMYVMLAVLAVMVFFMFRNGKKRQREQAELRSKVVTGADVMTNFGVFGRVIDIDEEKNEVLLETTPGTILRVHRQVVSRVVTPDEEPADDAAGEAREGSFDDARPADAEPEFGERVDGERPSADNK